MGEKPVEKSEETDFGTSWFRPKRLQWLSHFIPLLIILFLNAFLQGAIVNGLVSTSITSIEKRFKLTSTQSGIFAAIYDIFFTIMLLPLSLYAKKVNKVKWIGYGMLLLAIGSVSVIIPEHFAGAYEVGEVQTEICDSNRSFKGKCAKVEHDTMIGIFDHSFLFLIISQALIGIGATPLFTYGFTCIDDFDAHIRTGRNMAVYMSASTVGPAVAFIGGGVSLMLWGDFMRTTPKELGIENRSDPRWIGAWWVGFVICGVFAFFTALPLTMYPRKLKDTTARKAKDVHQTDVSLDKDFSNEKYAYFKIFWMFAKNPTVMCMILMQTIESILMNGLITFVPKLIELMFGFKSSNASIVTGILVVPVGVIGTLVGGYLFKRLGGKFRPAMTCVIAFTALSAILSSCLLLRCEQINVANINVKDTSLKEFGIGDTCNAGCQCSEFFNPVCAPDSKLSFLSPCHAGCANTPNFKFGATNWTRCACSTSQVVHKGFCENECTYETYLFFIGFCLMAFAIFVTIPIMQSSSVRVVHVTHRDQLLCFGWMFMRICGSIPGVILFGYIFDSHCLYWQDSCNGEKCQYYDARSLGRTFFYLTIVIKALGAILLTIAAKCYKETDKSNNELDSSRTVNTELRMSFRKKFPDNISPATMVY